MLFYLSRRAVVCPDVLFSVQTCCSLSRRAVLCPDVLFVLDDGSVAAHKALLTARCEMMYGMFSYNFRESSSKLVSH